MRVLTLNAGSSTLKASLVADGQVEAATTLAWADDDDRVTTLDRGIAEIGVGNGDAKPAVIAHRVVHGGERFLRHAVLDEAAVAVIAELTDLAPLHNTPALETIRAARTAFPDVPHVACFDTAYHVGLSEEARRYPVPERWHAAGIRRFGFHGLAVEWAVGRAAELLRRPVGGLAILVAHLGSGSSVTAVDGGASAWTSMGYTPLEGLMMGTRPGSLDPGILVRLLRSDGPDRDLEAIAAALEHESGLLGVSGRSSDIRELEAAADAGDEAAALALRMFESRAAAGIASAATWLPRLDAVVFSGGIGENAGRVRAAIVGRLGVIGLAPIEAGETEQDRVIAAGPPAVLRIAAREDLVMAAAAERLVGG